MKAGVTLIELLLAVTVLSLLAIMGNLFYSRFLTQNIVDNTTDTIVQQLRKAQLYSSQARKSETEGWGVAFSGGKVVLYQGSTYVGRNQTWDEKTDITGNLTVSAFEVNFARMSGVPDAPETINVTGNNDSEMISINSQGMVTR